MMAAEAEAVVVTSEKSKGKTRTKKEKSFLSSDFLFALYVCVCEWKNHFPNMVYGIQKFCERINTLDSISCFSGRD
jgi:hypothetical protein